MAKKDASKVKIKEHKLELFPTLKALDLRDKNYYNSLSEEEQKAYAPLILMRWLSACTDQSGYHEIMIGVVNDLVNEDFWRFSKDHKEFQHILMATCGMDKVQRHEWIAMPKNTKTNQLMEFLGEVYPGINATEIKILLKTWSDEEFLDLLKTYAMDPKDKDTKKLIEQFEKAKQNVSKE